MLSMKLQDTVSTFNLIHTDREGAIRLVQNYNRSEITTGNNWGPYSIKRFVSNGMEWLLF